MWALTFYRLYVSLAAGAAVFCVLRSVWLSVGAAIVFRLCWFAVEWCAGRWMLNRAYQRHIDRFKQELGPYGIRCANRAESDTRIKKSLAEVFTDNHAKLKKAVEQLEVMDTLFKAGMRPDADEYLLHDLKLKYGKMRLEKEMKTPVSH